MTASTATQDPELFLCCAFLRCAVAWPLRRRCAAGAAEPRWPGAVPLDAFPPWGPLPAPGPPPQGGADCPRPSEGQLRSPPSRGGGDWPWGGPEAWKRFGGASGALNASGWGASAGLWPRGCRVLARLPPAARRLGGLRGLGAPGIDGNRGQQAHTITEVPVILVAHSPQWPTLNDTEGALGVCCDLPEG